MIIERMQTRKQKPLSDCEQKLCIAVETALKQLGSMGGAGYTLAARMCGDKIKVVQYGRAADLGNLFGTASEASEVVVQSMQPLEPAEIRVLIFGDEGIFYTHVLNKRMLN